MYPNLILVLQQKKKATNITFTFTGHNAVMEEEKGEDWGLFSFVKSWYIHIWLDQNVHVMGSFRALSFKHSVKMLSEWVPYSIPASAHTLETGGEATESAKKQIPLSATLVLYKRGLKCVLCPLSAFTYLSALVDLPTVSLSRSKFIPPPTPAQLYQG